MKFLTVLFYTLSAWFVGSGFYKLTIYTNLDGYFSKANKNAYVGGDAYNYIINSERATAYFVLAMLCFIVGTIPIILRKIEQLKSQQ